MNILIMHFIQNATQGEKFILQKFLKKRYDSISEDEITFWLKMIEKKGALDLSFNHLKQVSERAIEISDKTDKKLFRIVSFVISCLFISVSKIIYFSRHGIVFYKHVNFHQDLNYLKYLNYF